MVDLDDLRIYVWNLNDIKGFYSLQHHSNNLLDDKLAKIRI